MFNQNENSIKHVFNFNLNRYIKNITIGYYNPDNLIGEKNIEDLICPICFFILREPISCSDKNNSHSFCKQCIAQYLIHNNNNKCPICKLIFEKRINIKIMNELNKLEFKCHFKNEGCNNILSYKEYLYHVNNCKFSEKKFQCKIRKYNYKNKEFETCDFIGNKKEILGHFNQLIKYIKFYCRFCNENILLTELEEHMKNKCKFGIIKSNGFIYIGEKRGNIRHGYGIFYNNNEYQYKGEFKNDLKEGYGRVIYDTGERYESEFKNNLLNGYCILHKSNGDKYEGQIKDNKIDGIGTYYFSNGNIFQGEFKDGINNGFGIIYYPNGERYEGQFKNGTNDGKGLSYLLNGDIIEDEYVNGVKKNNFVYYSHFGFKFRGNYNNSLYLKNFYFIYRILLFLEYLYSIAIKNKITLLFIIILIFAKIYY